MDPSRAPTARTAVVFEDVFHRRDFALLHWAAENAQEEWLEFMNPKYGADVHDTDKDGCGDRSLVCARSNPVSSHAELSKLN